MDPLKSSLLPVPTETVGPSGVADQPTTTDSLGFTPYVQAVAAFLTHSDTKPPLTLSIEGPWGSGKSSFMRQLQLEIGRCLKRQNRETRTVWFNAWRQNKDEELWAAFALHFSREMVSQLSWFRRRWCHLKLRWLRFEIKKAWLDVLRLLLLLSLFVFASIRAITFVRHNPTALPQLTHLGEDDSGDSRGSATATEDSRKGSQAIADANGDHATKKQDGAEEALLKLILAALGGAAYILVAFMFLKKGAEIVGNPLKVDLEKYIADPKYENRIPFVETFQSDFAKLVKCFAQNETVFVFIDDLDRCEVPKSADLMQALNLMISDSPNIVYIMGLDREKIAAGIAAKFRDVLPYLTRTHRDTAAALDFGFNYLEKFIQIPFQLPRPTISDVNRLMQDINRDIPEMQENTNEPHVHPGILFETKADSSLVREIVQMVAPAFDFNPRRIKQFINCFRVQAIIASQTGMFGASRDPQVYDALSPHQLGKLIAICLRWPRFLDDIIENPALLHTFPYRGPIHSPTPLTPAEYWSRDSRLVQLIEQGPENPQYSMMRVDIERFLQIAPRIRFRSTDNQPLADSPPEVQFKVEQEPSPVSQAAESNARDPRPGDRERDHVEEGSG